MRAAVACFRALVMGGRDLALTARIGDDDHARSDPCKPPWAQHRHIDTDSDSGVTRKPTALYGYISGAEIAPVVIFDRQPAPVPATTARAGENVREDGGARLCCPRLQVKDGHGHVLAGPAAGSNTREATWKQHGW